jgi:hypothetical protein
MLTVEYAKDASWNSADEEQICLTVKFEEFQEEIPFTATSFDSMPYGVELYNRAKAGEFGDIAPYVAPFTPAEDQPTTVGAQTL